MNAALTDDEQTCVGTLAVAWNQFLLMGKYTKHECDEFRSAIHIAQSIIMCRGTIRAMPDLFGPHPLIEKEHDAR